MGYIEEQIRELREIAEMYEGMDGGEILKEFADTIESLYKKLNERNNNGWIPCSEILPDSFDTVLAFTEEKQIVTVARDGTDWVLYDGVIIGKKVIAWQPLPEPYIENQKDMR